MRHEFLIDRSQAVALLVDMQERLMAEVVDRDAITKNAVHLVTVLRALEVPILVTEQNSKVFGPTVEILRMALGDARPVEKLVFSCLKVDAVRDRLQELNRRQVVIFGIETHICVAQTALDAVAAGFDVHVAFDTASARKAGDHAAGVEKMKAGGVVPASKEIVIYDLLERAGTEEFRKVLPVLKEK